MTAPTDAGMDVGDYEASIKGAIMLSNRRSALGICPPQCLKCNHVQVQLVRSDIVPAEWKCRICKHPFLFEPDAHHFIAALRTRSPA